MLDKGKRSFDVQSAHVKQELKLLEIEQLPGAIETSQVSGSPNLKYVFTAKVHRLGGKGTKTSRILGVTFFNLATSVAEFRMFFNKKNFVTEKLSPERKWSRGTVGRLITYWQGDKVAACADGRSAKRICEFFKSDEPPCKAIENWQNDLRKSQLATRHKKETDRIDERMRECRELPKDFEHWVSEVALDFSRYIYYKRRTKKLIDCYCTSCKRSFELRITKETPQIEARHGNQGKCPECGKVITFMAEGKTTQLVDEIIAAYAQKTKDGFAIRYFEVKRWYRRHYRSPIQDIREYMRDFYTLDPESAEKWDVQSYEYTDFKQTHNIRWCYCHPKSRTKTHPACLYSRNLRHVFADTYWKYSAIYELAKNIDKFNVWGYLKVYYDNPQYEYMVKARLYRIVAEDIDNRFSWGRNETKINFQSRSTTGALGIGKAGIRQLLRLDGGFEHLYFIRGANRTEVTLKDKDISEFIKMGLDGGIVGEILRYATPHKIFGYIKKNLANPLWRELSEHHRGGTPHTISTFWNDYLTNCQLLGYDMKNSFVVFPRHLKERHDEAMKLYEAAEDELHDKAIRDMFQDLLYKFGFSHKGLVAIPPTCANDIVAEGHDLHHCVSSGSYIGNMAQGKGFIFFIRKEAEPDEPFYTAEVKDGVVKQCRGQNNCTMTKEVKQFINQWQKKRLEVVT